jgi:predicted dehydrogenase
MTTLRILFCGLGSIGRRHARLIQSHFPYEIVALRSFQGQEPNDLGLTEVSSWEEVDAMKCNVAFITNPTFLHTQTALRCAERGMHIFLEKPIDCTLDGLDSLCALVRSQKLSAYVAYPLRFHPVVRALKEKLQGKQFLHGSMVHASYLPNWRPKQNHRLSYSSSREKGGGVLLEMSHEVDLAQYLFGPILGITGRLNRLSDVTVDADDCADLVLRHGNAVTNVYLSMFGRMRRRVIEVDVVNGYLRADLCQPSISEMVGERDNREEFSVVVDDMYVRQLEYFFSNLGSTNMDNNLLDAVPLFRKLVEFREAQY